MKLCVYLFLLAYLHCGHSEAICPKDCDCGELGDGYLTCVSGDGIPNGNEISQGVISLEIHKNEFNNILLQIEVIKLQSLKTLRHLHITECGIQAIQGKAFEGLNNLTILDLSFNQIKAIQKDTFLGLNSLVELHLLSSGVVSFNPGYLPSLLRLDLESNHLTTISNSTFNQMINLENLYLADNKLTDISSAAFSKLRKLKHLSLFGNNLTIPSPEWLFNIQTNKGTIEMKSRSKTTEKLNPWKCCEKSRDFIKYIKTAFLTEEKTFVCDWPPHLHDRLMTSLRHDDVESLSCSIIPARQIPASGDETDMDVIYIGEVTGSNLLNFVDKEDTGSSNFLSGLDNGLLSLVILVFGLLFAFISVTIYHCRCSSVSKPSEKNRKFFPCSTASCGEAEHQQQQQPNEPATERSTIPFKQDHPSYGFTSQAIDTMRANGNKSTNNTATVTTTTTAVVGTGVGTTNGDLYSQINRTLYLNDTDQSEDEIWDIKTQQKFKA